MITAAVRTAKRQRETIGRTFRECPTCGSMYLEYEFLVDRSPVCGCQTCGLLFLNPAPEPSADESSAAPPEEFSQFYAANAEDILNELVAYSGITSGRLLIVGENEYLSQAAGRRGFETISVSAAAFESGAPLPDTVNLCVLFSSLQKMFDPLKGLDKVHGLLAGKGAAMIICPTTDSQAARIFRSSWWEFNRGNRFYFSTDTLQTLLVKAGFGESIISPDPSFTSLEFLLAALARRGERSRRQKLLHTLAFVAPFVARRRFRGLHSRTHFLVRPKTVREVPLLSVIVPVYNEAATFRTMMDQLLEKSIEGMDIEMIVVESNSTDGTREQVQTYASHPRVSIILQDKPMGKGFAVRSGLKVAAGDVVLFQDADLEYDLNDYEALLAPILRFETNFVLGSRHNAGKNTWKIRKFSDSTGLAAFFNFGHLVFLTLFNVLYRQHLTDPFTMFKVFRRDCIWGLAFECNRFDFDHEIVIKLLRKGYKPLELPVNYVSRSMKEGKKITILRDPLTWLRALVKFRTAPIYEETVVQPKE
ncbi:MAG: glycosyltransferase [Acidobacteriaceae bacterium]|nr:glycosyltransferase [Acidobacteriaceae bacterium]